MMAIGCRIGAPAALVASLLAIVLGVSEACAVPTKLLLHSQFGAKVNSDEADFCLLIECKPDGAEASPDPGGFTYPLGIATAPSGDVYVVDPDENDVQELTPSGRFVLMFGAGVNETKVEAVKTRGGNPTLKEYEEENLCTEAEVEGGARCGAGTSSEQSGGFNGPKAVAVDPVTGNVYVSDVFDHRIDEYSEAGRFVLTIGKQVNLSKLESVEAKGGTPSTVELEEENLCTQAEVETGASCKAGVGTAGQGMEQGALSEDGHGGELAVGGPADLLYAGNEHGVQEFDSEGKWVGEISLASVPGMSGSTVRDVAVDQAGEVYLGYYVGGLEPENVIREFDAGDNQVCEVKLDGRGRSNTVTIEALAADPALPGVLAVSESEESPLGGLRTAVYRGSLYNSCDGRPMTEFRVLSDGILSETPSLSFNAAGELYGTAPFRQGLIDYVPKMVAELITGPVACKQEQNREATVAYECELTGQVDPAAVAQTEAFFRWGGEALSGAGTHETPRQSVTGDTLTPVQPAIVRGLRPNEILYSTLAAYDEFSPESEGALTGEEASTHIPAARPRVIGMPSVSFVKSASAVMFGELNPENSQTKYYFQYASTKACEEAERELERSVEIDECPGMGETPALESDEYGTIAARLEATGLQPATSYRYGLFAANAAGNALGEEGGSQLPLGSFTTAAVSLPLAITGGVRAVTANSAIVSGTVNPSGQPAVFTFELGLYEGAATRYGVVFSGSAGSGSVSIEEAVALSGLQPGDTYAYRIDASGSDGFSEGAPETFTTAGLPSLTPAPVALELLPVPSIVFPKEAAVAPSKELTPAQKLARALKACAKKPKRRRTACERDARKTYAVTRATHKGATRGKGAHRTS